MQSGATMLSNYGLPHHTCHSYFKMVPKKALLRWRGGAGCEVSAGLGTCSARWTCRGQVTLTYSIL